MHQMYSCGRELGNKQFWYESRSSRVCELVIEAPQANICKKLSMGDNVTRVEASQSKE